MGYVDQSKRDIICNQVTHVHTYDNKCLELCGQFGCRDP